MSSCDYRVLSKIGEGTFGEVYKARNVETGEIVALKKIRVRRPHQGIPKSLLREIKALQLVDHENVVRCYDFYPQGSSVVLVMELMQTDLMQMMKHMDRPFSLAEIKSILVMLLRGVDAIHQSHIIHRDLKPANLLFSPTGVLKLGDFGLARVCEPGSTVDSHQIATRWYRSPESLFGNRHDGVGVDLWAVGCIVAELLQHGPLFAGENDIDQLYRIFRLRGTPDQHHWPEASQLPDFHKISFPSMPPMPLEQILPDAPASAVSLLSGMLAFPPHKRLTALQALQDDFFLSDPLPVPPSHFCDFFPNKLAKKHPNFSLHAPIHFPFAQ
eukprot:TRINITY_DN8481_c0_g1_i1.p1 TRINITY_DN8481_c0_g1~~TRINITY_DN8481_c0_g1_i1.p1  ORF type:complete len:328 (+),score=57.41 TRINITY_DN8481_c0_g1_i1:79-1062(+)